MAAIEFAGRGVGARAPGVVEASRALARAALAAGRAPLVFGGRPWRWRIAGEVAELRVDWRGGVAVRDRDGGLLALGCGAALDHARVALVGAGVGVEVLRLPEPADAGLMARVRVVGGGVAGPAAIRAQQAIALRRSDGGGFAGVEVPVGVLEELRVAGERDGVRLHVLPGGVVGSGVLGAEPVDRYVRYVIVVGDDDTPLSWLRGGEALSAVLLAATMLRLATSPLTGVAAGGRVLGELVGGVGCPMVVLRVGVPADAPPRRLAVAPARAVARARPAGEIIDTG